MGFVRKIKVNHTQTSAKTKWAKYSAYSFVVLIFTAKWFNRLLARDKKISLPTGFPTKKTFQITHL